eukprot:TRINITY_DN8351_c0_g1_i1.p3 TRINITY_DN8351_c0_g1~~TRINITY_DN8351_c0_g1_i1.p3  ORF type:complete len:133 (+),score=13.63 TRINITY_DN8351_c0_g1_i1:351-749(+)
MRRRAPPQVVGVLLELLRGEVFRVRYGATKFLTALVEHSAPVLLRELLADPEGVDAVAAVLADDAHDSCSRCCPGSRAGEAAPVKQGAGRVPGAARPRTPRDVPSPFQSPTSGVPPTPPPLKSMCNPSACPF